MSSNLAVFDRLGSQFSFLRPILPKAAIELLCLSESEKNRELTTQTVKNSKIGTHTLLYALNNLISNTSSWKYISKEFYFTFWKLSLCDLYIAVELYQSFCRTFTSTNKGKRCETQKDRSSFRQIYSLKKEFENKIRELRSTLRILYHSSRDWFSFTATQWSEKTNYIAKRHRTILREMLLPRFTFSPTDALYCAKFCELMHALNTPGFYTILHYCAESIKTIMQYSTAFTEIESKNFAFYLRESLETMQRWTKSRNIFSHETNDKFGWVKSWKDMQNYRPFCQKTLILKSKEKPQLKYPDFCKLYIKHYLSGLKYFSLRSLSSRIHHLNLNAMNLLFAIKNIWPDETKIQNRLSDKTRILISRKMNLRSDVALRAQRYMLELDKIRISKKKRDSVCFEAYHIFSTIKKQKKDPSNYSRTLHFLGSCSTIKGKKRKRLKEKYYEWIRKQIYKLFTDNHSIKSDLYQTGNYNFEKIYLKGRIEKFT
jgi:hypothetical protein